MNEARLRELLREVPVPGEEAAERRGLAVVEAAFAERVATGDAAGAGRRPVALPRLALALGLVTLLTALLLSPAGAAVRDWVGDVFTANTPRPEPGLAEVPGGGRLLVESAAGPWVVQPDGSRRLLGQYREATWSPRGLFVAAVAGRELSALEPDGTPHWTIAAPRPVLGPRWSPSGVRIAYRSGAALRVTAADGSDDHLLAAPVAAVAPAWSPLGLHQLAYVDARGRLRIAAADSGAPLATAPALPAVRQLEWAGSGTLVEASASALRVRRTAIAKLTGAVRLGPPRRLALPPAATVLRDVALAPSGKTIAAVVGVASRNGPRSVVLLYAAGGGVRRLLNAPGRISEVAWAPHDDRLLLAWPSADQWLFLPTSGRREGRSLTGIAAAFAPGERGAAPFPRLEGWCCHAR